MFDFAILQKGAAVLAAGLVLTGEGLAATFDPVGVGAPVSTVQPSLALTPIVRVDGLFNDLGTVKFFAGNFVPIGWAAADGSVLPIDGNEALFSTMGTTYGGDGVTTFRLPDLRGRAAVGIGQGPGLSDVSPGEFLGVEDVVLGEANMPAHAHLSADGLLSTQTGGGAAFENRQPGLGLDFEVTQFGIYPTRDSFDRSAENTFGFVTMDAALRSIEDPDQLPASGQLLSIGQNQALFSLLGTAYGGDGRTTFGLPDLRGRIVTGTGGASTDPLGFRTGAEDVTLTGASMPAHAHGDAPGPTSIAGGGLPVSNEQPSLTLNYLIATEGIFPSRSLIAGDGSDLLARSTDPDFPFLGEIALFAGNFVPRGFALADGSLLPIASNAALFSILGTNFGGDGKTTFALPDLQDRVAIGAGQGPGLSLYSLGQRVGSANLNLTAANLPAHTHSVERMAPIPLPAGLLLLMGAVGMLAGLRRVGRG
ncbi:phage tail protein [Jannaschia formosa]|uniref:phage tail protein n=1 Tax=Jannaschia formosa TaxID=2259592 RepID=UPI001FD7CCA5|nr:tail fiber protein [Jannaschia formosa]